eukprot:11484562-Heterocapsa_arctica.AAC.1
MANVSWIPKLKVVEKVLNPDGLNTVKDDIENKKLAIGELFLPFWNIDNDDIIISFNKTNVDKSIKADELIADQHYKGEATYRLYASAGRGKTYNVDKPMSRGYIAILNAITQ